MALLLAATSTADVVRATSSFSVSTTAGQIFSECLEGINASSGSICYYDLATKVDDFWLSFYMYRPNAVAQNGSVLFEGYDKEYSPTQPVLRINQQGTTASLWKFQYWDGAAWVDAGTTTFTPPTLTLSRIDLHIRMADTGGILEVYMAGELVYANTVTDTLITGVAGINQVGLGYGYNAPISGIIAADEDTRSMVFLQTSPNGAGAHTAWSGGYMNVDEPTDFDDRDFISTGVAAKETFTFTPPNASYDSSAYDVVGVVIAGRMSKGADSPVDIRALARVSGADYDLGSFGAVTVMGAKQKVFDVNPATATAWTFATAQAAEFGVEAS